MLRYVDNIFAVFDNDEKCTKFLHLLSTQHKIIKFTMEYSLETIPFLDVKIKINDTGIETWVYKKTTNTNLCLNFNAMCPTKWKSGLILLKQFLFSNQRPAQHDDKTYENCIVIAYI